MPTTFLQAKKIAEDYVSERINRHTINCVGIEFLCKKTRNDNDLQGFLDFLISYFDEKKLYIIQSDLNRKIIELTVNIYSSPDIEYTLLAPEEIAVVEDLISEAQDFYSPSITICIEPDDEQDLNTVGIDMEETKDSDISPRDNTIKSVITLSFLSTEESINDQLKSYIKDCIRQWFNP